jgi:hypothetical protein
MEDNVLYQVGNKIGATLAKIWDSWSDDKHISWVEAGGVVLSGGSLVINIFSNFAELKSVVVDGIDSDELEQLEAGLLNGYDLHDNEDEAVQEAIVSKAILLIKSVISFFTKDSD